MSFRDPAFGMVVVRGSAPSALGGVGGSGSAALCDPAYSEYGMIKGYYLGCSIWGNKDWVGELFTKDAKTKDFLQQYASVFNTVEGNTTFYGLPSEATVARWREETSEGFRFAFKFSRAISHEKRLVNAELETAGQDVVAPTQMSLF